MLGLILFLFGLRHRLWLAVCGALQQGHVVIYKFLETRVSLQDLEAAGLPFAVSSLLSSPNDRAPWFTTELARLPDASLSLAGGLLLAGLAYAVAAAFLFAALLARRLAHGRRPVALRSFIPQLGPQPSAAAAVFSLCVLGIAVSPLGALAEVETQVIDTDPVQPGYVRPRSVVANAPSPAGPAAVNFIGGDYRYALLVNGVPHVVRGMGYNVEYASLDHLQRAELYDRDFRYMRDIGVNVIFGWFQDQFDTLTLAKAHEYGLGVAMPFELNQDHNYDDPAVRARLTEDVLRYVTLHKNDPAVWFWTPGNEVIHRLLFPSWVRHQADELNESRADSFARFYVDLVDRIHAIDPRHPVIYRDAEDHYLPRIQNALLASGKHRPWFAYGTNVYSRRLGEILEDWPNQGLDSPLVVSEFAPGGTGAVERPHALRSMWETIRSYPSSVIGGAIYTWSTNGPEELDRVFGLVDESGLPRGEALATVAEFYRDDRENK
jgi:hypothetical protein